MNPETVLNLICTAPERYESVRAALRYRGDGPTIKAVRKRFLRSEARRRAFGNKLARSEKDQHPEPDGPFGWRCNVWRANENRWRRETQLPGGGVDIEASTGRMLAYGTRDRPPGCYEEWRRRLGGRPRSEDPRWLIGATDHYWTMYPFDPDSIAGLVSNLEELDLRVDSNVQHSGREAVRLSGVPVEEWHVPPEPLWWGADEYEVLVDAECGILLRCASRLNGRDFDVLEVEEVHFDERFGPEVFARREPLNWR